MLLFLAGMIATGGFAPGFGLRAQGATYDLSPVASFHYQLQNLDISEASASPFPLLVTDYSLDGSEAGELSPAEVSALKSGGRTVLAYLSIGEAETYRFYWNPAWDDEGKNDPDRPAWLGPVNPDWPDNLEVRYWDPAWQAIIFGNPGAYLDRIIAQGFDGVYLDIVDAYEFWGPEGNGERPTAAADMIAFVEDLAAYARSGNPSFAVVPQNASALVADAGYLSAISGIGAEDTWFEGNRRQSRYQAQQVLPFLDQVLGAGKAVLLIDYPRKTERIDEFFDRAQAKGYGAYNSTRELDRMTIHPTHPPSPGPTVSLTAPADGVPASSSVPPTFEWTASGAVSFELHFSGEPELRRVKRLPPRRKDTIASSAYTPSAKDWGRMARLARRGDGVTLRWWVVAIDAAGGRRSSLLRTILISD